MKIARRLSSLVLAALLCGTMAAADSVSGNTSQGYGRLLFGLTPNDQATAQVTGAVLTITFPRKVDITPAAIAQALPGYISSGRADADGKTFRFALSQTLRLHTSSAPGKFAVDLAPASFSGAMPDLPQPVKAKAAPLDITKLPEIKVRSGAYHNFTRVVFDWPRNVPYNVFPGSGKLTIRFDAAANPDFSALDREAPPWVKSAGWHLSGGSTIVDLNIDSASGYHDFRDGTHIVVDVLAPKTDADAYTPPGGTKPKATQITPGSPKAIAETLRAASHAMAPPATGAPAKLTTPTPAAQQTHQTPSAPPPKPQTAAQSAPQPAAQPAPQAATQQPAAAQATPTEAPSTVMQTADGKLTKDGGAILIFPGAGRQSAAVFTRGLNAWVILQNSLPLDIAKLKTQLGNFPTDVEAASGGGTTKLRIALRQPLNIAAFSEGSNLKVVIGSQVTPVAVALDFARNQEGSRSTISTLMTGAARVEPVVDPTAGDEILIIPGLPGRFVPAERNYVEFTALPSAAGLVLMPYVDDLAVGVQGSRVTISRPNGLSLTPPSLAAGSPEALAASASSPSFLDMAKWKALNRGSFLNSERRLRAAAARLDGDALKKARLKLAEFYLSNGFAAEALGVINFMQAADAGLASDAQLQTMKAAASYFMGRYRDTLNALASAQFDQDRHAALWRGLASAGMEDWENARANLDRVAPVLKAYDPEIQARAHLAGLETALATNRLEVAEAELERVPEKLSGSLALLAKLDRARVYAEERRGARADSLFDDVEKSGNERYAVQAVYYRVVGGLENRILQPQQAINALERLRYRWRGDGLELKTVNKLAALYFAQKRWREGLIALRVASQNYPNTDAGMQATDQMRNIFVDLFMHGKADAMNPVQSLGLFYDFIDLTPIGPDGDEMIRRMADRLVKVDLLGPAADLLDYQVTKRLDGVGRAQVATRLAMVQLMDHKPQAVLDTLRTTQISTLPDDVLHQRLLIEARALTEQKKFDQALDLISVDQQPDTVALRAQIYWKAGKWPEAGQMAEAGLGERWKDETPLSDAERQTVMRAAISYSLASDQPSLDRLRTNYAAKMKASTDAAIFSVLTERIDLQGIAFRDAAAKVASIDTLKSFMQEFGKTAKR